MGLGQPVGGLYRSISSMDRQASAALRPRPMYSTYQDAAGNRHSRVLSETNLPSAAQNVAPTPESKSLPRSVSALGSTSLSSIQRDERSFRYDHNRSYLTHHASSPSMNQYSERSPLEYGFEPRSKTSSPSGSPAGLGIVTDESNKTKISNIEDFNSVYPADPPSRTQSQLQVHDLQDQMKGLHIKISSLKVKTQEDNLRRRSLQSLRTPSPLTAADPWYVNAMEYRDKRGHLSPNPNGGRLTPEYARDAQNQNGDKSARNSGESGRSVDTNSSSKKARADSQIVEQPEDVAEIYEDAEEGGYDNDMEIDRDELNEILREPLDEDLDDVTPHEEREDAFDYEHFILHSALGNYSRSKLRRANSNVSNVSVETTRPAHARSTRHSRTNSATSYSTAATYATAAEEENDLGGVLYWDRRFNDGMAHLYLCCALERLTNLNTRTPRPTLLAQRGRARPAKRQHRPRNRNSHGNPSCHPSRTRRPCQRQHTHLHRLSGATTPALRLHDYRIGHAHRAGLIPRLDGARGIRQSVPEGGAREHGHEQR